MRGFSVGIALVVCLLAASPARAQSIGTVTGTVADDTGGVLPGVSVTLTTAGSQAFRETVTDSTGTYRFDNVPAGTAELTFRLINFSTGRRMVTVAAGATATANARMQVATSADIVITAPRTSSASLPPAARGRSRQRSLRCVRSIAPPRCSKPCPA
jgi:hypothetical protein